MEGLFKSALFFAAGYLVARYLILNTPNYKEQEAAKIDEYRNRLHDWIKELNPDADDQAVSETVVTIIPEN